MSSQSHSNRKRIVSLLAILIASASANTASMGQDLLPWEVFTDPATGSTCDVIHAQNADLVLLRVDSGLVISPTLAVVSGTDTILTETRVDGGSSVFFKGVPFGVIAFATDAGGNPALWWLDDLGRVVALENLEPISTTSTPSDLAAPQCDACTLWDHLDAPSCILPDGTCAQRETECCFAVDGAPRDGECDLPRTCCFADSPCDELSPATCAELGGVSLSGSCGEVQACVFPNDFCSMISAPCCGQLGAAAMGAGTACGDEGVVIDGGEDGSEDEPVIDDGGEPVGDDGGDPGTSPDDGGDPGDATGGGGAGDATGDDGEDETDTGAPITLNLCGPGFISLLGVVLGMLTADRARQRRRREV
ncbi:MAG: hypothetical protein IID36_02645 [Planctomycetes bacterium]|nr:hypothetical protein [Planctomycetota bacterium]